MLLSVENLFDYKIEAKDGAIGKVHDFFLDDRSWNIRYAVVDTHTWLPGRRVLISPESLQHPHAQGRLLPVSLTREQVRKSPDVDLEQPVSRQYEQQLHQYYRWTPYWYGGYGAISAPAAPMGPATSRIATETEKQVTTHLRSARELAGYRLHAKNGEIGHVEDFILEDENWVIRYFVVDTRNWLPGKKVLLSTEWIREIDWSESEVHVNIDKREVQDSPEFNPNTPVNREYETRLYDYYGRPKYWLE